MVAVCQCVNVVEALRGGQSTRRVSVRLRRRSAASHPTDPTSGHSSGHGGQWGKSVGSGGGGGKR